MTFWLKSLQISVKCGKVGRVGKFLTIFFSNIKVSGELLRIGNKIFSSVIIIIADLFQSQWRVL